MGRHMYLNWNAIRLDNSLWIVLYVRHESLLDHVVCMFVC